MTIKETKRKKIFFAFCFSAIISKIRNNCKGKISAGNVNAMVDLKYKKIVGDVVYKKAIHKARFFFCFSASALFKKYL